MSDILQDSRVSRVIEEALMEDLGMGDVTTDAIVSPDASGKAEVLVKEDGVIAGLDVAVGVFRTLDPDVSVSPLARDGDRILSGTSVLVVDGSLAAILKAERTALNILQRMSGIATMTRRFVDSVTGLKARITDTRKTAPGLRLLDKRAVTLGGGVNHRFGLDDMILIKDNHIAAAGSITAAVRLCMARLAGRNSGIRIEVEVTSMEQLRETIALEGVQRVMFDNIPVPVMTEMVSIVAGKFETEASGNVRLETVRGIAETGVDFISVGALTHSVKALDISLEILPLSVRPGSPRSV